MAKREAFARKVGTTANHLNKIAHGQRRANETLAVKIEYQSKGAVRLADLHQEFAEVLKRAGYRRKDPEKNH